MKSTIYFLLLLFLAAGCSSPETRNNFPLDSLLQFNDGAMAAKALHDSVMVLKEYKYSKRTFFKNTPNELLFVCWTVSGNPDYVVVTAAAAQNPANDRKDLPAVWKTRDGLYAGMSLEELQSLNGKPFYLLQEKDTLFVMNWEGGKLAESHADLTFTTTGGKLPEISNTQELIDKKLKIIVSTLRLWKDDSHVRKGLQPSGGHPGNYPQASTRLLTEDDLKGWETSKLMTMRNEIFARHGYIFKFDYVGQLFEHEPWYKPAFADVSNKLTELEKKNLTFILQHEELVYKGNPLVPILKTLPLLSLPIDLENIGSPQIPIPAKVPHPGQMNGDDEEESSGGLYGLLPDTSRYYAVLWEGPAGMNMGGIIYSGTYLTTYAKNFMPIMTVNITVDHDTSGHYVGDCNYSDDKFESVLNEDLTYRSTYTATAICAGDEESHEEGLGTSGWINRDGTIKVNK